MNQPLLIPDLERLRRKLAKPSPWLTHFREQMAAENVYLPALLGETDAIRQAKANVLHEASAFRTRDAEDGAIEGHTWCVAPQAMRLAVYFNWLEHLTGWTKTESQAVADGLLHFCYEHAVAVLRGRAPAADNQSFSLALCCAVTGQAVHDEALREFGMKRMMLVLQLAPRDGYWGEGSAYQSGVVAPLAMWACAFLGDAAPSALRDVLRLESRLGSPGSLWPGWDNYGWSEKVNLSPIALWASLTGETDGLRDAARIWDRENFIAWGRDDRMWALIYWPEEVMESRPATALSGWSLPETAAVIDDSARRARLTLAWDKSSSWLQAIGRGQVNPNHVLYELDGQPIFGDGMGKAFLEVTPEQVAAPLNPAQCELLARQYGSLANWANAQHPGLIGAANTIFLDNDVGYFPLPGKCGQLCYEQRSADRHIVTAESVDYFRPRYDLTRAQRTIAMNTAGVCWIVDDYRSTTTHRFTWQLHLRLGGTRSDNVLHMKEEVTLAWLPVGPAELQRVAAFPERKLAWPDDGSDRLRMTMEGDRAQFVVCVLPWRAAGVTIRATGANSWRVEWGGGSDELTLPEGVVNKLPETPEALCDLDDEPFALSDEPNDALLAALENPDPAAWRRTTQAIQTLAQRRVVTALPMIDRLLRDTRQRYHVHSVAAWCLGRMQHRPSLEYLRYLTNSPETNTALHAQWAVERMS